VDIGKGKVELTLLKHVSRKKMKSTYCYILDQNSIVSLWIGKNAGNTYRIVSLLLARELFNAGERPPWGYIERISEGTETEVFRLNFQDWITKIDVDHASYLKPTEVKC